MKPITSVYIYFLLLVFCTRVSLKSQEQANHKTIKTVSGKTVSIQQLEKRIIHVMDSLQTPGLSIAIINDAAIAYNNTFGVINMDTKEPATSQTIFEAASLSKPVFAYFTMKMVEQGLLSLDESILPFLKEIMPPEALRKAFDDQALTYYETITPRIVLSHGTGMPNWAEGQIQMTFKPGTGFSYSGEAYQHLAASLGTKLGIGWGKELDNLFIQQVALPLEMHATSFTWSDQLELYKAKGHWGTKVNTEIHRDKKVGPGYSLSSHAVDYAHFLIEMMEPKNLKPELVQEMLTEHNHFDQDNELFKETGQTGWGLGFAQKPTPHGLMHLHTGNNHDFQAYAMFVPDQKYGFVLFANSDNLFPLLQDLETLIEEQF